jgi:glutathione peroxidase
VTGDRELFQIPIVGLDGETTTLEPYRGKVLLIVNVASACGFTPQYQGLEVLWRKFRDEGFVVLGFPCNQFGRQEPKSESDILCFTKERYSVSFPLFAKIEVNGSGAHPIFKYLKHQARGLFGTEFVKWNFTKFLLDREGEVVHRFAPATTPSTIEASIARLLA